MSEVKLPTKVAPKPAEPKMVRTVYGIMVDPHTGATYTQKPSELPKLTGWVQSQVDAGKMVLVAA